jgi:serine/threonine protein kinase
MKNNSYSSAPRILHSIRVLIFSCIAILFVSLCFHSELLAGSEKTKAMANSIWRRDRNIGLSHSQLGSAFQFIEKIKRSKSCKDNVFLKSRTKLPCEIERVPSLNAFLIKPKPARRVKIGSGVRKTVRKAIFYGQNPKIVAECLTDSSGADEINILNMLKGCKGIVPFLGSIERPNKHYSIFLDYFSAGSLSKKLKQKYHFTTKQILKIAKDSSIGLRSLHDHHFVHRDLHCGNILLRPTRNGLFDAALVDFEKSKNADIINGWDIPQAAKTRNPPEALVCPVPKINRYLVDVYALGCNFYYLNWGGPVPWQKIYSIYALHSYNADYRKKLYKSMLASYKHERNQKIGALLAKKREGKSLRAKEKFQILVFQMMHYNPRCRPPVQRVCSCLQHIAPKL